jgi:hypothetical protein
MIEQAPTGSSDVRASVWRIWFDRLVGTVNGLITTVAGCFGPGQTWQNFSPAGQGGPGGRLLGTQYANSTGRPIWVKVTAMSTYPGNSSYGLEEYVDGNIVGNSNHTQFSYGYLVTSNIIVPPGKTYQVNGQGYYALYYWWELR